MNGSFKDALLGEDLTFYHEIKATSEQEQEIRLNVYRNNIVVSLVDALADIFPVTQAAVGEEFFRAMSRVYLLAQQPTSPVISEYGVGFSDFIRAFEPANSRPFLADLAALEHAMLTLTHSEEYQTLEHQAVADAFAAVEDPSVLQLNLPPTTQILAAPFAIGSLYNMYFSDGSESLHSVDLNKNEYLLLVKSHLYAQLHVLQKDEAIFIKHLIESKPLAQAVPDSETFNLGETLAKLIEWKILTHIQ